MSLVLKSKHGARFMDLTGTHFGRLTVIKLNHKGKTGASFWKCECSCGDETVVAAIHLRSGHTKSCGCLKNEGGKIKHGATVGREPSKEYRSWAAMKTRCLNPNSPKFPIYGGRGIRICERWINSFENFVADIGLAPSPNHTVDRINTNGNYEPSNCKWSTAKEQANNTRCNSFVEWNGERLTKTQWADRIGITSGSLDERLESWPLEKALTTPPMRRSGL